MRISEKCSCGASIEVDHTNATSVQNMVKNWRKEHNHQIVPKYWNGTYGSISSVSHETPRKWTA